MRKFLIYLAISFLFANSSCNNLSMKDTLIGVKIYAHDGDLAELFEEWNRVGINLILASPELAAKDNFMSLARSHSMRVFVIVPTFFNTDALDKDSSLYSITSQGEKAIDDWVEFICPNRSEYRISHIQDLKTLAAEIQPDGISLDFIRYFVYWEKVFPDQIYDNFPQTCFDEDCLGRFLAEYNVGIPDTCISVNEKADFILQQYQQEWTEFKCNTISGYVTEMVEAIRSVNPEIEINFHAVPWKSTDFGGGIRSIAGQDLKQIAPLVDYISPMCYHHMVIQSPEWVHEVVNDIAFQAPDERILPSIQVNKAYLETSVSETEFRDAFIEALRPPSDGVVFWSWEALEESPEKLKVVRDYIDENF
ncbi:MAG: hypothetical protein PVH48_08765 [Cyclobacteriaceae bacterium]